MASRGRAKGRRKLLPGAVEFGLRRIVFSTYGLGIVTVACAAWASLATWSVHDPSFNNATRAAPRNLLGGWGAVVADLAIQSLGLASIFLFLPLAAWGWHLVFRTVPKHRRLRTPRLVPRGHPPCCHSLGATAAEELAASEWSWRHLRRFLHGRRPRHRPVPAGGCGVLRGRPRVLRDRYDAASVRLWHQHVAADRAVGAKEQRRERMGERLARGRLCISLCTRAPSSSASSRGAIGTRSSTRTRRPRRRTGPRKSRKSTPMAASNPPLGPSHGATMTTKTRTG